MGDEYFIKMMVIGYFEILNVELKAGSVIIDSILSERFTFENLYIILKPTRFPLKIAARGLWTIL